jgi:hypothetical protein
MKTTRGTSHEAIWSQTHAVCFADGGNGTAGNRLRLGQSIRLPAKPGRGRRLLRRLRRGLLSPRCHRHSASAFPAASRQAVPTRACIATACAVFAQAGAQKEINMYSADSFSSDFVQDGQPENFSSGHRISVSWWM